RGYGNSEDGGRYSIEAEFDDILALAQTINAGPVNVVGHSYGALCALGAATHKGPFRRLVLYEPPLPVGPNAYFKQGLPSIMREALGRGDAEAAMVAYLTHAMAVGSGEIARMRRLGSWAALVQHASRVLRELEAVAALRGQISMFRRCRTPTLLLLGGKSP